MSTLTSEQQKELQTLQKILDFPLAAGMTNAMPADPNAKTVTKALVQGGVLHVSTNLKPKKQISELELLERIINSPS